MATGADLSVRELGGSGPGTGNRAGGRWEIHPSARDGSVEEKIGAAGSPVAKAWNVRKMSGHEAKTAGFYCDENANLIGWWWHKHAGELLVSRNNTFGE